MTVYYFIQWTVILSVLGLFTKYQVVLVLYVVYSIVQSPCFSENLLILITHVAF